MYFADVYLSDIQEIITDGKQTLLRLQNGLIYDLKQKKVIFRLIDVPDKCALKDNLLVYVYDGEIFIYDFKTGKVKVHGVLLNSGASDISFKQVLAIACYNSEIFIFDENLVFKETVNIDNTAITTLLETRIGLVALTNGGTVAVYKDGVLTYKSFDIGFLTLTVWDENQRFKEVESEMGNEEMEDPQIVKLPAIKQDRYNRECCDVEIIDDLEHIETIWQLELENKDIKQVKSECHSKENSDNLDIKDQNIYIEESVKQSIESDQDKNSHHLDPECYIPKETTRKKNSQYIAGYDCNHESTAGKIQHCEKFSHMDESVCYNSKYSSNSKESSNSIDESEKDSMAVSQNMKTRNESENNGLIDCEKLNVTNEIKKSIDSESKNIESHEKIMQKSETGAISTGQVQRNDKSMKISLQNEIKKKLTMSSIKRSLEDKIDEKNVILETHTENVEFAKRNPEQIDDETIYKSPEDNSPLDIFDDSFSTENSSDQNTPDIEIVVGDIGGHLYFIDPETFSYRRRYASRNPIEFLFFSDYIYCIADGFVRKINKNGARKIYGIVGDKPGKIFKYGKKMFCIGMWGNILPLNDEDVNFFERIMMKKKQTMKNGSSVNKK